MLLLARGGRFGGVLFEYLPGFFAAFTLVLLVFELGFGTWEGGLWEGKGIA